MPQPGYFAQLFRLGIHLDPKLFIVKFRGYCHHFFLELRGLTISAINGYGVCVKISDSMIRSEHKKELSPIPFLNA